MSDLHPHVAAVFAADPITGSAHGHHESGYHLGDVSPAAVSRQGADLQRALAEATSPEAVAELDPVGTRERLERDLLVTDLHQRVEEHRTGRPWARAPYWYAERAGEALTHVMEPGDDGERLVSRLGELPAYLRQGVANLEAEQVPASWARMGAEAGAGLTRFLTGAVRQFGATLSEATRTAVEQAVDTALPAVAELTAHSEALAGTGTGSWVAGQEHLDLMLEHVHHSGFTADRLLDHGRAMVERADAELAAYADQRRPGVPWTEQIEQIKELAPEPEAFLSTYAEQMAASKRHTVEAELLTLPAGEDCVMEWVPEFLRASLPLGVMHPVRPYTDEADLGSVFLITPADPTGDPERLRQHRRDNCHAFTASIAGHETYPGHHVQHALHKRGTARGSVGRFVASVPFVEGWGLYTEDLMEETGFMDDAVALFRRRNTLWRALRIVVDMGLHTGALSQDDAVALLRDRAAMDEHMAAGEVRRYTRHDNPTYPSSYLLGRDAFHRLRDRWQQERPKQASLREFHDALLAYGSPPHALLEPVLFADGS